MKRAIFIFEDHTAARFRPLAWGTPVYELGWGMFNLRERVETAADAAAADTEVVLLPRRMLAPLQMESLPDGMSCGVEAALEVLGRVEEALFVSARIRGMDADLARLIADSDRGSCSDDQGLLVARLDSGAAGDLLQQWDGWDALADDGDGWIEAGEIPPTWIPGGTGPELASPPPAAWNALWDRIPYIGEALVEDINLVAGRELAGRIVFGAVPAADARSPWCASSELRQISGLDPLYAMGASLGNPERIWIGEDVVFGPGVVVDAQGGPVIIESGVTLRPGAVVEGPVWLGAGSLVKSGARLGPQLAVGPGCKLGGEIVESQIGALSNKQHDGFLGHALLGSWVNLGAGTNNSDLKNNYSEIRVDVGRGPEPTGQRFLGLLMADHSKSAIGSNFNTGTAVGFSSNVFAVGFPPKFMPSFSWGDGAGDAYDPQRALATAAVVMERRGCRLTSAHRILFLRLAGGSS